MDILNGFQVQIDMFWYNILLSLAGLHWSLLRGLILMGYTIELVNNWLIENAFIPLITQTNASLSVAINLAFVIAMLILGITYLLAAFVRLEVVNLRSAIQWYIAGALFFSAGPALYQGMNDFRIGTAQAFYASTLTGLESNFGTGFNSLNQVTSAELGLGQLCDYLGVYLPSGTGGIDGLDVALAYLRADGPDVMGYPYPVATPACPFHYNHPITGEYVSTIPTEWYQDGSYFSILESSYFFPDLEPEVRTASIDMASSAQGRLLTAWPLVLFGVVEQMVYLLITVAQGITFISFGVAVLFAFFKKTEVIARSIIDQWIELVVLTVVIALIQSLVAAFFLMGTASGSSSVVLGMGLMSLIFMVIALWSGVKAVWNSFNRLFNAMGQATGGVMPSPGQATTAVASAGGAVLGAYVGLNANLLAGMSAMRQGGTVSQAAGISFGGSRTLSGAARTLAYLPGIRGTSLGDAAEQFTEGSITRTIARNVPVVGRVTGPVVGAMLLTDRNPDNAEYDEQGRMTNRPMLVPAIGEGLDRFIVPPGAPAPRRNPIDPEYIEGEDGEMLPVMPVNRPRRMGRFTPVEPLPFADDAVDEQNEDRRAQRSIYASEMQGEEMEQHISDVMRSSTGVNSTLGGLLEDDEQSDTDRMSQAAGQIEAAATRLQLVAGQLQLTGTTDIASVMGDVVQTSDEDELDYFTTSDRMATVMGMTTMDDGRPAVRENLPQFGLYINQALRLGLSGMQAEQVVREVKDSPSGQMMPETHDMLTEQLREERGYSYNDAEDQVNWLAHTARTLPDEITAVGMMPLPVVQPQVEVTPNVTVEPDIDVRVDLPETDSYDKAMKDESAMSGSGTVIGGDNE